jgi:AraC family transcriptional regulator of adaptative response / DNA-3-methyladenine glycosylase II
MSLTHEEMLATLGTRDPANNGKFIIGVLSTGIYCLPSCHARTPKPENVRFFRSGAEAEAAGLRPCKKCRPDEYERGENRELEALEDLANRVRLSPADFTNSSNLADGLGVGSTKLNALFRLHYQTTPSDFLTDARVRAAKSKLVNTDAGIAEIAYDVGYESLSVFNDNFKRRTGLTPSKYRTLPTDTEFAFELPLGYHLGSFVQTYSRDPISPTERFRGSHARIVTPNATVVQMEFAPTVRVSVERGTGVEGYEALARIMNFNQDAKGFEGLAHGLGFAHLVGGRTGARVPQTLSLLDGLIWAIAGQQINLPFAYALRQRLFSKYGEPVGDEMYSVPTSERLAEADPADLRALQFSRQKADYLVGIARLGEGWMHEIESASFTRAKAMLLATRGFGVWSSNYILMRALGFVDCVPLGDTGLTAGLASFHSLESKPILGEIEELMMPFAPYRSLATYHLWQSLK